VIAPGQDELAALLAGANVVIDAILGTGFAHDQVRQPYAGWIEACNAARQAPRQLPSLHVIAADCPSGLNAQTGRAAASCITADVTVTMLAAKTGLIAPHARPHVGAIKVAPLVEQGQ
jgi:NAD(P)H-hydrate epimerase